MIYIQFMIKAYPNNICVNVETSGFNKQTWQKFWNEASKQVFTNKQLTEVTFVCVSRDNFHQTRTGISAKRGHRYNTTKCLGSIFNIYWTKDVEDWAARQEKKDEGHKKDWYSAGGRVDGWRMTEEDIGDRVRWKQVICCGDP